MQDYFITTEKVKEFKIWLIESEKSKLTVEKYLHDVAVFYDFLNGRALSKGLVLEYKQMLIKTYKPTSVNSMIASLNAFLRFIGRGTLTVKQLKIQRQIYVSEDKELTKAEFTRLVATANSVHNARLSLIIQTICGTGIRVSELQFITVEAVKNGEAQVSLKGKRRTVFIVPKLKEKLLFYINKNKIKSGAVFVTKCGKPVSRSNIWREMKGLCKAANVNPKKVFPHNLRHLFARTFYGIEKDIVRLADILGHSNVNTTRIYIMSTGEEHCRKLQNMRLII